MKYAFIIMDDFDMQKDSASIHDNHAQIIGVSNLKEACMAAKRLYEEGIDCIELCGAFGPAGAKEIIDVKSRSAISPICQNRIRFIKRYSELKIRFCDRKSI